MINFKNKSSDRLIAAATIGKFITENVKMMSNIKTLNSGISILYNHESMWVEAAQTRGKLNGNGRSIGAVMCSPLSYFEALSETGLQANFKEIKEFDFSLNDYTDQVIILSHQIALTIRSLNNWNHLLRKEESLIADGLTGYY